MTYALLLGFLIGIQHAMEADHVAAVASLASGARTVRQVVRHGVVWGMGHTATLLLFGGAVVLVGTSVPDTVAQGMEFVVGIMLVGLGLWVLVRLRRERIHFHSHRHDDGRVHFHAHSHAGERGRHDPRHHRHDHATRVPVRTLLVGMTHGMAGSAALVLLSAASAGTAPLGLLYIVIFGAGSILGMAVLSAVISVPMTWAARSLSLGHNVLQLAIGGATIALGAVMIYRIGIVGWLGA